MECEVRNALHRARNPDSLVDLPLVQSLCRQSGEANPVAALEVVPTVGSGISDLGDGDHVQSVVDLAITPL